MSRTTFSIEYLGRDLVVSGYYDPAENEVRYYEDGSGYPGCAESLELDTIKLNGRNIIGLLSGFTQNEIAEKCLTTKNQY